MKESVAATTSFYYELTDWWPLFSPHTEYVEEAADLLARLGPDVARSGATLLELGSGGGSLAFHLQRFELTLTDISSGMLAQNRKLIPRAEHIAGDMRTLRLDRQFDIVLIHDAIMYATTPADLQATLRTATEHCRAGGTIVVLPDYVRETFEPGTDCGGHDATDGRGLRYLEWRFDPDPADDSYVVDYAFSLRETDGTVAVHHDRHIEGLFARAQWLGWFETAGAPATPSIDPWNRDVFIARKAGKRTG